MDAKALLASDEEGEERQGLDALRSTECDPVGLHVEIQRGAVWLRVEDTGRVCLSGRIVHPHRLR